MIAETAVPTLLEDWRSRRSQLEAQVHEASDQAAALLRVLDYLIRRYEGTEAAKEPARVVALQATVVNTRAMVVHHHLWSGVVAGVKNRFEAQQRIAGVLHRMEESARTPVEGEDSGESDSFNPYVEPENYSFRTRNRWNGIIRWAFWLGHGKLWAIRGSLNYSPFLLDYAVKYLAEGPGLTMAQHTEAIELLAGCASRCVFESAVEALGNRLVSIAHDAVTEALTGLLREPTVQEFYYPKTIKAARTRLRERLAAEDPHQRRRAIRVLALLGDLHDIGLLADLAAVCEPEEAFPEEHAALLAAMDEISRRPSP
jgi:hypothetical protein